MMAFTKKKFFLFITFCSLFFFVQMIYDQWPNRIPISEVEMEFVDGWDLNTSRNANDYISSGNETTLLKPGTFCDKNLFLMIMVCTDPFNFELRNAIRNTWASNTQVSGYSVATYFLMGETNNATVQESIIQESERYNDILQEHFVDSYNNLTLKSVMMLKLVDTNCVNKIKFLMKTDDDTFVNIKAVLNLLEKKTRIKDLFIGNLFCNARPIRNSKHKWYAPRYMYSEQYYPHYLSGAGYAMSRDLVPKLYNAALKVPIFHMEDIYITGILPQSINVKPRNEAGFFYYNIEKEPCVLLHTYIIHKSNVEKMHHYHTRLQNINADLCKVNNESSEVMSAINKFISLFSGSKHNNQKGNSCV